jgi:hypothetical protein
MNPRMEHESFLEYILRWLDWRAAQKAQQAQLEELISQDGWESDAELARRLR